MRRWQAGDRHDFAGITVAIYPGRKEPGDLVLRLHVGYQTFTPRLELALALIDFFAENEQYLTQFRPWWKYNGRSYVLQAVGEAVKDGWEAPAQQIRHQQARRST